jgi:phenylalanyl-tRNA synthetase beta chain
LDGNERELAGEDLLICDGATPLALAGIMGGMNSEVRPSTRSVLLESANFNATAIRRTAKRLGLHSEAAHRFERGVDPEATIAALERAADLLAQLAGATRIPGVVDRYPRPAKLPIIALRQERIENLLGVALQTKAAEQLLRSLGVATKRQAGKTIRCVPPASRPDLTREADLIEELARLYGYDKIPSTLPRLRPGGARDELHERQRALRSFLAGEGLVEVVNLPFTSENLNGLFPGLWEAAPAPVAVVNPLVKEEAEMRLSLIPGLIENLRTNAAQKAPSFHAYHIGKVFRLSGAIPQERLCLAAILYGPRLRRGLGNGAEHRSEFLDCKGLVEGLFELLRIGDQVGWSEGIEGIMEALHPGRRVLALVGDQRLGYVGQVHPRVSDQLDLPPFMVFELDLERLLEYAPRKISVRNLPRFPAVGRDFALVVERDFQSQRIISWINSQGEPLIEHVEVFDEYRGAPIPENRKSLAYKISYRAEDRTLTDAEVNELHQDLVAKISQFFGAELRT